MLRFDDDGDAQRFQRVLDAVEDFDRQPFLHLQAARERIVIHDVLFEFDSAELVLDGVRLPASAMLPEVRGLVGTDVEAAFHNDPAAPDTATKRAETLAEEGI